MKGTVSTRGQIRLEDGTLAGEPVEVPAQPISAFQIPQAAQPPAIAEAEANFDRLAEEWHDIESQIAEGIELRGHEVGKAHEASATRRVEGKQPLPAAQRPDAIERKWDAKLADLRAELPIVADALDQAGDTLMRAIEEHRSEWQEALDALDDDATQRLSEALDAAEAALADLLPSRAAPSWLLTFNAAAAINPHGTQTQYPGNGLRSNVLAEARKWVTPTRTLVGYKDGGPLYRENVLGRPKKLQPIGTGLAS